MDNFSQIELRQDDGRIEAFADGRLIPTEAVEIRSTEAGAEVVLRLTGWTARFGLAGEGTEA